MFSHLSPPSRSERGITGLETAIILIAFVVVASVFAFTVLSTGVFSSERGKETIFAGLEEAQSSMSPRGAVIAYKGVLAGPTSTVFKLTFDVALSLNGRPIDLSEFHGKLRDKEVLSNVADLIMGEIRALAPADENSQ